MRQLYAGLIALSLAGLAGCSQQQKVEASNSAQRANQDIKQAAAKAQQGLSDGSITLKVKTAMASSANLDTSDINVDTRNRVVTLKGTVDNGEQKALAERIAHDTVGDDTKVMSQLAIRAHVPTRQIK